jgi:pyruvate/2-oxoglutarate dehydrogenase complex dihydrolipoamide acyltransferase (E2) component
MPKVGETSEGGTILAWLVAPGDSVKSGDLLAEVMTDKVNYQVESPYTGTVTRLLAQLEDQVPNGGGICEMEIER